MNLRRASLIFIPRRRFSSESEAPSLYSFLRPSIFALKRINHPQGPSTNPTSISISQSQKFNLEATLQQSLSGNNTDEAWKSFKALSNCSCLPSKSLTNSLITHLSSHSDTHSLKRAYASAVYVLEKHPSLLEFDSIRALLDSMRIANAGAPAFALVKSMFKSRFFMPFDFWGNILIDICRKNGSFAAFVTVFHETCKIASDEKMNFMNPNLAACNAALECYCIEFESVVDAEKVVEIMSVLGVRPDECSLGFLACLYASKGLDNKVAELDSLISKLGVSDKSYFIHNLVCGYAKSSNFESVCSTIQRVLKEGKGFNQGTYDEVLKRFIQNGNYKNLANLIISSQKLESSAISVEKSVGYGIINACINLGFLDKAHGILDEINAQEAFPGLGVYVPILNAYCKEQRTAEAAVLVSEVSSLGLQLDANTYDVLIESSISCQDYQSAFSLFRDMREARIRELKPSYLTIMTGLTEHHRPELMAAFLDDTVHDPRIEITTHDWNSIIHAFCKAGRLEDARRTFRRMIFLQFEPNEQTYLSLINGYVTLEKYFSVLMLWNEVRRKLIDNGNQQLRLNHGLVDAFLCALVKGGFFDAVMQVVEASREMKIFVDKWRYKQAFMEKHKKLRVSKLRKRDYRKMQALVAFKNWVGLST